MSSPHPERAREADGLKVAPAVVEPVEPVELAELVE